MVESEMKKKKSRRSKTKYPALDPSLNLKTRTEQIDYDYIHKLSPKEKKWLNKFTEEFVNDSFDRNNLEKNLYANTPTKKKECDDRNNARNRCILTQQRAQGKLEYVENNKKILGENPEETMNREIDEWTSQYHEDYNILRPIEKISKLRKAEKK